MSEHPIILAIESSCDDTALALIKNGKILSEVISSSEHIHQAYGGVVPELASRSHQKNIVPLLKKVISLANIDQKEISAIAATLGPGLIGSLLVGVSFAKSLAMAWQVPFMGIHHIQGHIMAHFISGVHKKPPSFPFLALIISGGHTQLVQVDDFFKMKILGETLDDAVGEAFDKIAKIWGLTYPGGPLIDRYGRKGNIKAFKFSKPKVDHLNFSFSGLKTHVLYFTKEKLKEDNCFITSNLNDLCACLEDSIAEILLDKVKKAMDQTGIYQIALAGGVSANFRIREVFSLFSLKENLKLYLTPLRYAVDNASMIAKVAELRFQKKDFDSLDMAPRSKWDLNTL